MRGYILRALLVKEVRRHVANRGGLALAGLLVVAALLLSVFDPTSAGADGQGGASAQTGGLVGGVHHCYIEYADDTPLVRHLKANVPDGLRDAVTFRYIPPDRIRELITYPPGVGSIQIREDRSGRGRDRVLFLVWHPKDAPGAMAGYEAWFWKEARRGLQQIAADDLRAAGADPGRLPDADLAGGDLWAVLESFRGLGREVELARESSPGAAAGGPPLVPAVEIRREGLAGTPLDLRSAVATAMVVFALYFACVYLLPTLTCEERERGVLLAQALSPASPAEILVAKFLFYPTLGVGLAAVLAGIYKPAILATPFFWIALVTMATGFLGIGMTVATLARTQRAAFMGSMCYLMSVALLLFICQQNGIPGLPYIALEFHGPRILHAAITGNVGYAHWMHLIAADRPGCHLGVRGGLVVPPARVAVTPGRRDRRVPAGPGTFRRPGLPISTPRNVPTAEDRPPGEWILGGTPDVQLAPDGRRVRRAGRDRVRRTTLRPAVVLPAPVVSTPVPPLSVPTPVRGRHARPVAVPTRVWHDGVRRRPARV